MSDKKDMFKCPKCNNEAHWRDWDYFTSKDSGAEIPSLGFDTVTFDYLCYECEKYSSRDDIEKHTGHV